MVQCLAQGDWSTGRTPYQVIGTVAKLRLQKTAYLTSRWDIAATWNSNLLDEAVRAVDRASVAVKKLTAAPKNHVWYGTEGEMLTLLDDERLQRSLADAETNMGKVAAIANDAAGLVLWNTTLTLKSISRLGDLLRLLSRAPSSCRQALSAEAWMSKRLQLSRLVEAGLQWTSLLKELTPERFARSQLIDIANAREEIARSGNSIFRIFRGAYRQAVKQVRDIYLDEFSKAATRSP